MECELIFKIKAIKNHFLVNSKRLILDLINNFENLKLNNYKYFCFTFKNVNSYR